MCQTGVYETTGYARNCYVTTGQTGTFGGGGGLSTGSGYLAVNSVVEKFMTCNISNTNLINFDVICNSIMYYTGNSTRNFYLNLRGNSATGLNTLLSLNDSLSLSFIHTNSSNTYALTGINIDSTERSVIWAGGPTVPSGINNSTNVYSITVFKTGDNLFKIFGSLGFFI
jgi:hypothetical protein